LDFLSSLRDAQQNLSWKLGFGNGIEGQPYSRPWWADRSVYALAYLQGKSAEFAPVGEEPGDRGYYTLIARAILGLPSRAQAPRRALYDRARRAQTAQLSDLRPPPAEFIIKSERRMLEQAIRKVEAEWHRPADQAMSDAKIISDFAAFMTKITTELDSLYDVNTLPHSKQEIIAAMQREIVRSPLEAYAEWLQAGAASLWNFIAGVGPVPLTLAGVDRARVERLRVIAEKEYKQIEERIDVAVQTRSELRADGETMQLDISRPWRVLTALLLREWSRIEPFSPK
jgi:hypothetical protein